MNKILAHLISELRAAMREGYCYDSQSFNSDARERLGMKSDFAWITEREKVGIEIHFEKLNVVDDRKRVVNALRKLATELAEFETDIE
jgi:hypothetical protein